ncbi:MAG: thioredoxin family protein [Bacteroidia bacterium]|nr:thioredoxin family protein [Bacteroidia bacterium]
MKNPILLTLLLILNLSCVQGGGDGYKVGDMAMNFELKNIDGKVISLQDYNNEKGVIVIFTCNHCPFAVAYEDRIVDLNNKYSQKGYPVVAIQPNDPGKVPEDSFENMKVRAKESGFTFPYVWDETQKIASAYGATKTPHVYLLQKGENGFQVKYIGAIDDNYKSVDEVEKKYLEDAINALLSDMAPEPNFTKAIGCTIKWK